MNEGENSLSLNTKRLQDLLLLFKGQVSIEEKVEVARNASGEIIDSQRLNPSHPPTEREIALAEFIDGWSGWWDLVGRLDPMDYRYLHETGIALCIHFLENEKLSRVEWMPGHYEFLKFNEQFRYLTQIDRNLRWVDLNGL